MFIRVKRRKLISKGAVAPRDSNYALHLVLVESYRSKGKPLQRILKYLGSIKMDELEIPIVRQQFMSKVGKKLDQLDYDGRQIAMLKMKLVRVMLRSRPRV
jgi:hypothetical protein